MIEPLLRFLEDWPTPRETGLYLGCTTWLNSACPLIDVPEKQTGRLGLPLYLAHLGICLILNCPIIEAIVIPPHAPAMVNEALALIPLGEESEDRSAHTHEQHEFRSAVEAGSLVTVSGSFVEVAHHSHG